VSLSQFRNNILFYLFRVSTRVDRIDRDAQPVDIDVARGTATMIARNENYFVFTLMKFISDDEMVSITLQRGTRFRNKQRRIGLELMKRQIS
jgi:hypothetical protein